MTNEVNLLYLGMNSAILTFVAVGILISAIMPGADKWNRRYFVTLFVTLMLCLTIVLVDLLIFKDPDMATEEKICVFLEFVLIPLPMPMFTMFLLRVSGEDWRKSKLFRTILAVFALLFVLLIIAQFTTAVYYITPDNKFYRGDWYFLMMIIMTLPMIFNLGRVGKLLTA